MNDQARTNPELIEEITVLKQRIQELEESESERKRIEAALRESEERYKNFVEKSFAGVYVVQNGLFVYLNDNAASFAGYNPEELKGRRSDSIVHPEDLSRTKEKAAKMLKGKASSPYEFRIVTKDGQIRWIMEMLSSIQYDGRKAILGNSMDITERKQAEEALRESEEKYRAIIENIEEGYHEVDIKGNFTFFNESMCKFMGYEREELLGMNNRQYTDEENARKVYQVYNRVYRTGEPVKNFEWQIIRKDGDRRDVEVSISLIRDAEGHPTGFRGIARDTTERKRVEEELRQSEEKYRDIFDKTVEGIYRTTPAGRFLILNPAFARICGYASPEEMTEKVTDIANQLYANPEDRSRFQNLIAAEGEVKGFDVQFKHPTKGLVWISINSKALRDEQGNIQYYDGTIEDVTERKRSEEALRESEKRYRELTDFLPISIFEADATGGLISFNRTALEVFRYNQEDYKEGMNSLQFFAPEEWQRVGENMGRVIQGTSIPGREFTFLRKDGSTFIGLIYASPKIHENKAVGIRGAIIDITERKLAEESLRHAEERYRSIFENAQEGIYQITPEGRFIMVNPAMAKMFGYKTPEELMTSVTDIARQLYVNPEERKKVREMIEEKGSVKDCEAQFYRKDGSIIWVSLTMRVVRDEKGHILYYEGMNEDITERKESIERIRKSLKATVQAIAVTVETRDPYTAGHQRRVADLARAIAT